MILKEEDRAGPAFSPSQQDRSFWILLKETIAVDESKVVRGFPDAWKDKARNWRFFLGFYNNG